jgi:alpha-1,3-mannosyl-glycoprotein beta-1,2-N-acetylglucosaminyltransferase
LVASRAQVRVEYSSVAAFEPLARRLGIMDNVKAGVPRGAYHGVVTVRLGASKRKVHVALPLAQIKL